MISEQGETTVRWKKSGRSSCWNKILSQTLKVEHTFELLSNILIIVTGIHFLLVISSVISIKASQK